MTVGGAFCGRVGGETRCEYGVMGPSVNLAARLMCMCTTTETTTGVGVDVLCNDEVANEMKRTEGFSYAFHALPPIRVKGYSKPVTIYQPEAEGDDGSFKGEDSSFKGGSSKSATPASSQVTHTKGKRPMTEVVLMKMDQCGFKQQMIVKLCAALAISKHTTIRRSVIVGLYPGPSAEVDESLKSLHSIKLLSIVEVPPRRNSYEVQ